MSRKSIIYLALILVLLLSASPAAASAPASTTRQVIRETVTWTLTPGADMFQCESINSVVHGTGQRYKVIVTKTKANGSTQITENDRVSGTAVDANGETYTFLYLNRATSLVPPSGTPISIKMKDLFELKGDSTTENNLHIAFNWSWTYDPNTSSYWPPVDNWVKKFTQGDPFGCDPI